jgi:hypothetical protein
MPELLIVTLSVGEALQLTEELRFLVEPSL